MHMIVTGGTGFIGRAVVRAALAAGHDVSVLTRDAERARVLLPEGDALAIHEIPGIDAGVAPEKFLRGDDRLIHLAWAEVGKYTDPQNLLGNLGPQFGFLEKMSAAGVKDMTVAGSCLEYGMAEGALREDMPAAPATYYGLAKKTLHDMLRLMLPQDAVLKWLRYFYVYGEGQRPQAVVPQLLAAVARGDEVFNMSPGDQARDFIHVDTAARHTVLIAAQQDVRGVINIGNGRGLRVEALALEVLRQKGHNMKLNKGFYPYPAYEPFSFWADTAKLTQVAGIVPDDGIRL